MKKYVLLFRRYLKIDVIPYRLTNDCLIFSMPYLVKMGRDSGTDQITSTEITFTRRLTCLKC